VEGNSRRMPLIGISHIALKSQKKKQWNPEESQLDLEDELYYESISNGKMFINS
jgi:hypothetical protein